MVNIIFTNSDGAELNRIDNLELKDIHSARLCYLVMNMLANAMDSDAAINPEDHAVRDGTDA